MDNQQNQQTISIAEIDTPGLLIENLSRRGAFDMGIEREELNALLSTLPKEIYLDVEAAVGELISLASANAFRLGWKLARS